MSNFSANLCFLLWQHDLPQSAWIEQVMKWIGCDEQKAEKLLRGGQPSEEELLRVAQANHMAQDELRYADLLAQSGLDLWQENVLYLLQTLKYGEQTKLIQHLGISSSATISKWKNRITKPERTHKKGLQQFFGLPHAIDLENEALFLSLSPIDTASQRAWLHQKLDQINDRTLQQLFPALERLLRD